MKKILTTITLSLSALIATSAMAAPQHDPRFNHQPPAQTHWNSNEKHPSQSHWNNGNKYNYHHVNPSRDWRVGQPFPRAYNSSRYKIDYSDVKRLSKPKRHQEWFKINGDYVLVNSNKNTIAQII